jgi:hypothetical protein
VRNLLVIASLFFSLCASAQNTCGATTFGGPDVFPWKQAQPFPWTTIQGLWKVQGNADFILKIRVIRQTARIKQLEAEIYSREESCTEPKLKGVGLVTAFEKNVVRINVDNKLIKLAIFDSLDLEMNPAMCGDRVMAISMIDLGGDLDSPFVSPEYQYETTNMVLKKITSSLDLYCKKRN